LASTAIGIEDRLWKIADDLRANSGLRSSEFSVPVLGLIFLRYADQKFGVTQQQLNSEANGEWEITRLDYQAKGVVYLRESARFDTLLHLPEGADIGRAINEAMRSIEEDNTDLKDVLPKNYVAVGNQSLIALLKAFSSIPTDFEGDVFGKIYEYFLGEFAKTEGQRGGEFFTPQSIVQLIVEIIEPYHGRIYDPACGSGGMFVQSAAFIERHKGRPSDDLSVYGQEKTAETVRLCRMNLAVHGLSGDIKEGNSYYDDIQASPGAFDFVMANPPFNVNGVDKEKLTGDLRFPFGLPRSDNANYLWIQAFYSALNETGRAGFVMANSASDARSSEQEIRRRLLESGAVDVMVAIGPNFFYTVTLPCTLWFFDRGKVNGSRRDTVLFIDARHTFHQVDRAHRDFLPEQLEFLSNIVRLYRNEELESAEGSTEQVVEYFPYGVYADVPGLCKVATLAEIEAQGWSLNPGRYVGVKTREADQFDFVERIEELHEELELLNAEAHQLEVRIDENIIGLLARH
jgi:type I restriction enzyme M protein